MSWTVSRRIIAGFAVNMLLVVLIAIVGVVSLRRASRGYEDALATERDVLRTAIDARGALRNANINYLRYLVDGAAQFIGVGDSLVAVANARMVELRQGAAADEAQQWLTAERLLAEWHAANLRVIELWRAGNPDAAREHRQEVAQALRVRLEALLEERVEAATRLTDDLIARAESGAGAASNAIRVGALLALAAGILFAFLLNRSITRPLQETSSVLASSAAEILSTTTQQASGATESLAAVTQAAATVDQVVQTTEQSAERARAVSSSAQRAAEIGRQGRAAVDASVAAVGDIRDQVAEIGDSIRGLAEQAQAIGEIIATVNDLAEQTNLLALNAAIEAARAGEHGRGFAVVAGEVKALADESKAGTARVRQILEQVQRATTQAVSATERGGRTVGDVAHQVNEAGETIRQLAEAVGTAAQSAAQISASAGQQSTGMSQIRQAIGSIQQAAQQNLAATRQAEQAAQELNHLGGRLLALVGTDGRPMAGAEPRGE